MIAKFYNYYIDRLNLSIMKSNPSSNKDSKEKKWFTFSNISTFLMLVFVLAMIINPNVKAFVIHGLMKVGLFQPTIPSEKKSESSKSSDYKPSGDIAFKNNQNETVSLSQLKGKVVFLNFWATWCPPCIAEMPSINILKTKYKNRDNIVFLMVDADGNFENSLAFMEKHGYDLPVYAPATQIPPEMFESSLPTTVILDKQGNMVFRYEGSADYQSAKMMAFIDKLLASK